MVGVRVCWKRGCERSRGQHVRVGMGEGWDGVWGGAEAGGRWGGPRPGLTVNALQSELLTKRTQRSWEEEGRLHPPKQKRPAGS